jgi:glucose/arabinose dehydrogenase
MRGLQRRVRPRKSVLRRRGALALVALAAAIACPIAPAAALEAVPIGAFASPVYVAVAPGQPRLLFVVEQRGQIQVLRDEVRLGAPFLDIMNLVRSPDEDGGGNEQGLLSVAFPPDYAESGRFYVAFTNNDGDIEIDEFQRSAANAARADRSTRRILLVIPHPGATNHNGGQLQFGPEDGLLYISTGDGGNVNPRGEAARKLNNLLGKILRINPLPTASRPYRIPPDNPFVGLPGRDEIFAYGLRNPWRFSFDGARIAIGDVGQQAWEEINFLATRDAAGVNFGWPQYEGNVEFRPEAPGSHPPTFPMFVYPQNPRCAVVAGYVVRDPNLPALKGRFIYGDFCTGEIRSFIPRVNHQRADDDQTVGITLQGLSGFGKGHNGQIYFARRSGAVLRLAP